MRNNLKQALDNVDMMYNDLADIANDIIESYTKDIDKIINQATQNSENLTNDDIRNLMLKLSFMSYTFGDVKEKSALKADCAEALRKEAYARKFNEADGNNAVRDNIALLETSDEIVVNSIHDLVSSLFKTKLDELHRVVATLQSILMSRMQEAKLAQGTSVDNAGDKIILTK